MFNITDELKKLPGLPGVYLMHNAAGEIIYVGKAISLKNRVRQYFQKSRDVTPKIARMVDNISYFEYIVTDSEMEALILECNLIKKHRPRYNTMLKDDKTYPYIKVTVNEAFPRVFMTRQLKKDGARYFGPYTNVTAAKASLALIEDIYQVRRCKKNLPKDIGKSRPCLNYDIKKCDAPCTGYVPEEEYKERISEIMGFLEGNTDAVVKSLEARMKAHSLAMEFEEAAKERDLINNIKEATQQQKMAHDNLNNRDIIAASLDLDKAVVQIFFIRMGKLIGREHFYMENVSERSEVLLNFVKQYYGGTPFIPNEIVVQDEIEDAEIIEKWLSEKAEKKVSLIFPKRGEKLKMVKLAAQNASIVLERDQEKLKREILATSGAMHEIERLLGIETAFRMESYDISNISGTDSVGSMVVYENGSPKSSDYRKFKIRTVEGPNDYESMREVLTRRFTHAARSEETSEFDSFSKLPDLILMDGGKGQVGICREVLDSLGLDIKVCGMVKDDNHRTRALLYDNEEIKIDRRSEAFRLITRIQDETHRFAIEYHRQLRSKGQVHSVLDDIDGIGPKRRRALMKHFKSIEAVKSADIDELKKAPGMNEAAAKSVYDFFRKGYN